MKRNKEYVEKVESRQQSAKFKPKYINNYIKYKLNTCSS